MIALLHSYIPSNAGVFELTVFDDDGTDAVSGNATNIEVLPFKLNVSDLSTGYGPGVLASGATVTFDDRRGALRSLVYDDFQPMRYLAEITGPNFRWMGRLMEVDRSRAASDRVASGHRTVVIADGLARMKELAGASTELRRLAHVLINNLFAFNPYVYLYVYLDAWPVGITAQNPLFVRYLEELAGGGSGDYGRQREQLDLVAAHHGARLYQCTTDASWRFWHREAIGSAKSAIRFTATLGASGWTGAVTYSTQSVPADETDVSDNVGIESKDRFPEMATAAGVKLTGSGSESLIPPSGTLQLDPPPGTTLVFDSIIDVTPATNVRARVGFEIRKIAGVDAVGVDTVDVLLELVEADGTETTILDETINYDAQSPWNWLAFEEDTAADFPASGKLRLTITHTDANNPTFQIRGLVVLLVDDVGALITDWVITVPAGRSGDIVDVSRASAMEFDTGSGWDDVGEVDSIRTGETYSSHPAWQADDRLYQQAPEQENYAGRIIQGLHGPQRVLLIDKFEDGNTSRFLINGAELMFFEGDTECVLAEVPG